MKKLFTLFIAVLCLTSLNGQIVTVSSEAPVFKTLLASEVYFVLTGNKQFDEAVINASKKYWTVTKYNYVKMEEVNNHVQDKNKFFIMPLLSVTTTTTTRTVPTGAPSGSTRTTTSSSSKTKSWYVVVQGGRKAIDRYTDNDALVLTPVSLYGDESDYKKSYYRMNYMIKSLNDGIQLCVKEKLTGNEISMPKKVMASINKKATVLKTKTLVINKDLKNAFGRSVSAEKDFTKNYPFKYKFVSADEYMKILTGNSAEYVCLMPTFEVNKHLMIYEPATTETVYYGWSMQGLNVKSKDIKKLAGIVAPKKK